MRKEDCCFAASAAEAPIVHFDGPLTLAVAPNQARWLSSAF
jgi:hypothetical protein